MPSADAGLTQLANSKNADAAIPTFTYDFKS
jgi:hypothetical protein